MTALKHDNFGSPVARPDDAARPTVHAANREALHGWCDLARGVETFRGRWKPSILMATAGGPRTLPQLQAVLAEPARRVLIRALRELQADGLVHRDGPAALPVYALTPDAVALTALFGDLARWSRLRKSHA